MSPITFGIVTISDHCSTHKSDDKSGALLEYLVTDKESEIGKKLNAVVECSAIIPDNESVIMEIFTRWADDLGVNVILSTGGTGFSSRDVTPEATKKVIEKEAPGIIHAMLTESFKVTPMASLCRAVAGIRGKTLIINFPGSPKAVKECFDAIASVIPHAVDLILDIKKSVKEVHHDIQHSNADHSCPRQKSAASQSLDDDIQKCLKKIHHDIQYSNADHSCPHQKSAASLSLDNVAGRLRESPFPMISIEEAQKLMKDSVWKEAPDNVVDIWDAFGRVLADTVSSRVDLPPFRASIKDGYAVIAEDGKGKRKVLGGLEAGHKPGSVKIVPGSCVRINTGAPVPDEATAVVQVEDTILLEKGADGKEEKVIEILTEPRDGQDIRPIGSDIKKGSIVLKGGTKIGAVELGLLAACGFNKVPVTRLPKIGVLSTGNELQKAGEFPCKPGHVYDSNKITLMMMLKENGYSAVDLGIAADEEEVMVDAIQKAMDKVDVIITTGSVSMGDRDMLKPILKEIFDATIHFGRVNLKPGKPTTFATCGNFRLRKYFLCLPGNPVSAMVTAYLFVFPLLNYLTKNNAEPVVVKAKLTSKYVLDPRPEFARAILEWSDDDVYPKAYSTGNQISSKLLSCKNANALLMLPPKSVSQEVLEEGAIVPAMLLRFNQHVG